MRPKLATSSRGLKIYDQSLCPCWKAVFWDGSGGEYDNLELLQSLDASRYNAVCDAVPDLTRSMQYDYDTGTVVNFEQYREWVNAAIR